jgi:hypothetical protein
MRGAVPEPELSLERQLFLSQTKALIKVLGRKKAEVFIRAMVADLTLTAEHAEAVPIRMERGRYERRAEAIDGALRAFRHDLPVLLSAIT